MTAAGIDDLNVYGSTLAVEAQTIADARGLARSDLARLGLVRRALAPCFEDPVTLAANAARPIVETCGKDSFELLIVASESGIDYAKPLSSYVHRYLGLSERCFHLEVKHACFGATAALSLAAAWVETHPGKRALVIATDMARRLFGLPAEIAEGAGAVAMAITQSPRVLALEPHCGFAAREIYDIRRPSPTVEIGDTGLSLAAYLDLLEQSWSGYAASAGPSALSRLAYLVFHTPLVGLVQQAHRLLMELDSEHAPDTIRDHFDRHVRPSVRYAQELGNVYSGSLFAALASLVDNATDLPHGSCIGMYSYGSGSCASYFSGAVGTSARATVGRHRIAEHLAARRAVDLDAYERCVVENERSLTMADYAPDMSVVPGLFEDAYRGKNRLVLDGVRDFYPELRLGMTDPKILRLDLVNEAGETRITPALVSSLLEKLRRPGRIVTLEGVPGAFCDGLDLGLVADGKQSDLGAGFSELMVAIEATPRPVVAIVDGPALAGGCALAAAADLVLATPRATFGLPEVLWGLIPAVALPIIARRIGAARARLLALGVPSIDATEAHRWGLVDELISDVEAGFAVYARRLLRAEPRALAEVKALSSAMSEQDYPARASRRFEALAKGAPSRARIAKLMAGDLPWEEKDE